METFYIYYYFCILIDVKIDLETWYKPDVNRKILKNLRLGMEIMLLLWVDKHG